VPLRPTSQTSGCMPDHNMTVSLAYLHAFTKETILDDAAQVSRWCSTPCEASRYCTTRSHSHRLWAKQASVVVRCSSSLARKLTASSRTSVFKVWHRTSSSQSTIVTELYSLCHQLTVYVISRSFGLFTALLALCNTVFFLSISSRARWQPKPKVELRVVRCSTITAEETGSSLKAQLLTRGTRFCFPFHLAWLQSTSREYPPIEICGLLAS
jgi:hypothetical protein